MIDYDAIYKLLAPAKNETWLKILPQQITKAFDFSVHGTSAKWQSMIESLDLPLPSQCDFENDCIKIGLAKDISPERQGQLRAELMEFHPWRKGPYNLFGIYIDSEWRSDWKWQRLKDHISPLKSRLVLDVGCGNGYHCWRMLGAGARAVIGVDPTLINIMQFQLIKKLTGEFPVHLLPITLEAIPAEIKLFDSVFSMGVLYHRRSPIDHLFELKNTLRSEGELVLETLIVDGKLGESLLPEGRYAKMRNVWFLPSCETLVSWMARCGFKNIRVVDINQTSIEEQRNTEWMQFHSLKQFLDTDDNNLTCEGLPAPKRVIIIAKAP
jgi:tRNA (mo5U34)-methyltransferase